MQSNNVMNKYFCQVGSEVSKKIIQPANKRLHNMKNKAGGVDNINTKILKTLVDYIIIPLEHIFNLSIEKSIWSDNLNNTEVVPIHKARSKLCISNYRLISLISNIAQILEKIVNNKLYTFLKKHQILSENQYGFVKNKSTSNALNNTHKIYQNLYKSKSMIATFLDLAKSSRYC